MRACSASVSVTFAQQITVAPLSSKAVQMFAFTVFMI